MTIVATARIEWFCALGEIGSHGTTSRAVVLSKHAKATALARRTFGFEECHVPELALLFSFMSHR